MYTLTRPQHAFLEFARSGKYDRLLYRNRHKENGRAAEKFSALLSENAARTLSERYITLLGENRVTQKLAQVSESIGAGSENRTRTLLPEPDFESGASTSSATPAGFGGAKYMLGTTVPATNSRLICDLFQALGI